LNIQPNAWHWALLGLVLLILEVLAPGVSFLWIGGGALLLALLVWLLPGLALWAQFLLFGVLTAAAVALTQKLRKAPAAPSGLNQRGRSYIGRSFTLDAAIVNGIGSVRVDDGQWRIAGPDLPAASRVRVVAVDGATLQVEKAD
jgi:membrane protein implicated in regulation of membrane protease activity